MSNGNGAEPNRGVISNVASSVAGVLRRLGPEFIAIVLLNLVFVAGMFWLSDRQAQIRERALTPLLTACANSVPIEVLKYLAPLGHTPSP